MSALSDAFDRIAADLELIRVDLQWAFADGHWPSAPDPTRVAGINTQDVVGRDTVPGARYDIGIGNHRAREAYNRAVDRVGDADLKLASALMAWGIHNQPYPVGRLASPAALADALKLVERTRRRVDMLVTADAMGLATRPQLRAVNRAVFSRRDSARWHVDAAVRGLWDALNVGPIETKGEPMCRICGIRALAEKKGGRCHTCDSWKTIHGVERPTSLDADHLAAPRAAAQRRRERGEGMGLS